MKKYLGSIKFWFLIMTMLFGTVISAQQDSTSEKNKFQLGKHKFILNQFSRSPFIQTSLRNTLGGGKAVGFEIPIFEIDGKPVSGLRGDLLFVNLDLQYQYAVTDWLAVWGQLGLVSRVGSDAQAILSQGVNATIEFELGWLMKIYESEHLLISGSINLWNKSGTLINFYDYLQNIVEGNNGPDNQLVLSRNFIQGGGGIRTAWAVSEAFGLNGLFEFAYGESVDNFNENDLYYKFAISGDIDLNPLYSVPIGFAGGVKFDSFVAGSDPSIKNKISTFFLRTAYTESNNYLVALDMTWLRLPQSASDQTLNAATASLSLELYF